MFSVPRRCTRRLLQARFGASDEVADAILPPKSELRICKAAAPSRMSVYFLDGAPILVDSSSKGDLLPSVYALWRAPTLLPVVLLKHHSVTPHLLRGADLMLPGVLVPPDGLPSFSEGQLVAVCVRGNPAPVAVGEAAMDSSAAPERLGGKGKLLSILQVYRDCLWQLGKPAAGPNDSFLPDQVLPLPGQADGSDDDAAAEGEGAADAPPGAADGGGGGAEAGDGEERVEEESPEAMDALLDECFLQALRTTLRDKLLPLPSGILWNAHMLPARPPGTALDLKRSSHRKLSRFLQAKAAQGICKVKQNNYTGDLFLTEVHRKCPLLLEFAPAPPECTAGAPAPAGGAPPPQPPLVVEDLLSPTAAVRAIFEAAGAAPDAQYTQQQCVEVMNAYIKARGLAAGASHPSRAVLDPLLCDSLIKGTLKAGETFPTELPRADLPGLLAARMGRTHRVARGSEELLRRGALQAVRLTTEMRSGNKKVTRIQGLEEYLVHLADLAAHLQLRFAGGCTVAEIPFSAKQGQKPLCEVVLQGSHCDAVAALLHAELGVPKRYLSVPVKKKKKKGAGSAAAGGAAGAADGGDDDDLPSSGSDGEEAA